MRSPGPGRCRCCWNFRNYSPKPEPTEEAAYFAFFSLKLVLLLSLQYFSRVSGDLPDSSLRATTQFGRTDPPPGEHHFHLYQRYNRDICFRSIRSRRDAWGCQE